VEIVQHNMETQKSAISHCRPEVEIGHSNTRATTYAIVARMDNRGSTVMNCSSVELNAKLT
jgi:hypothetical protein